jgi:hypothetical protein
MAATSSLLFTFYIIILSTTILALLSYFGSFIWMVPCTWKERDDSTSKEKNTNILRKPLVALHKSSSDVNQWQLIHEASGPSFQELTIKHDPNNKDALFSLHESLEATARCLDILKQRGRIPDMVRRLEVNIARNIETITKHIRALKLAFELDPIRYSDKICQDSQKLEESVEELQVCVGFTVTCSCNITTDLPVSRSCRVYLIRQHHRTANSSISTTAELS